MKTSPTAKSAKFSPSSINFDQIKEQYDQYSDLADVIPKPDDPPDKDDLYNIPGTDIYVTPNEPVDPSDCQNWHGSMACNDLPPVGLPGAPTNSVESSYSECSICLTITPSIGPISLPPYTICRIKDECQERENEQEGEEEPSTPPNPFNEVLPGSPLPGEVGWPPLPYERVLIFKRPNSRLTITATMPEMVVTEYTQIVGLPTIDYNSWSFYSYQRQMMVWYYGFSEGSYAIRIPANHELIGFKWRQYDAYWAYRGGQYEFTGGDWHDCDREGISLFMKVGGQVFNVLTMEPINPYDPTAKYSSPQYAGWSICFIPRFYDSYLGGNVISEAFASTVTESMIVSELPIVVTPSSSSPSPSFTPLPPIISDPQPPMACCDLEPIMRKLRKLEKVLAPDEFRDCSVPKRWLYPDAKGQQKIKNYPELIENIYRMLDRVFGGYPFKVDIKDADPLTEGDQSITLKVQTIADAQKQILQYIVDTEGDVDALAALCLTILYESGLTHQIAATNSAELEAIRDYLDFKVKYKKTKLPMAFDPKNSGRIPKEDEKIFDLFPKLLRPTKMEIKTVEYNDDKSQNERLVEINKNAATAAAALAEKYSPGLIKRLIDGASLAEKLSRFLMARELKNELTIGDIGQFASDAERAYPSAEAKTEDPTKPYGQTKPAKVRRAGRAKQERKPPKGFG